MYNDMKNYIWKRFKEKPVERNIKRCDLFDDLERIAFEGFRNGQILTPMISESIRRRNKAELFLKIPCSFLNPFYHVAWRHAPCDDVTFSCFPLLVPFIFMTIASLRFIPTEKTT